jgi:hypothetical protein
MVVWWSTAISSSPVSDRAAHRRCHAAGAWTREVTSLASSPVWCARARAVTSQGPTGLSVSATPRHIRGAAATMAAWPASARTRVYAAIMCHPRSLLALFNRSCCGHGAAASRAPAVLAAMSSLRESLRALAGTQGGKVKEAEMACSFGCDQAALGPVWPGAPPLGAVRSAVAGGGFPARRAERGLAQVRQGELRVCSAWSPRARAAVQPDPPGRREDGQHAPETGP